MKRQVFDFHLHVFPDQVAERAIDVLANTRDGYIPPAYDGTVKELRASLKAAGYSGGLNCPVATAVSQVESVNRWCADHNQWPMLSLGGIHPDTPDKRTVLKQLQKEGFKGIKLHPEFQNFQVEEPRMQAIWQACSDLGLLVLLHCGLDHSFEPPAKIQPTHINWLIEQYPELTIVAGHFGGWKMWTEVAECLIGKKVYLDLAYTLGILDDDELVQLIRRHGVEKVLYATDAPWRDQKSYLQHFLKLPLTEQEQQYILWENAKALLRFD